MARTFLHNLVDDDNRWRHSSMSHLESVLLRLTQQAQEAWPQIIVDPLEFVKFLARVAGSDPSCSLDQLKAGDLYLVLAYALDVPQASDALEQRYMSKVTGALARIGTPPHVIADVKQDLRGRLFEMQMPGIERQGYSGRGELGAWLCVTAIRQAGRSYERAKKHVDLDDCGLSTLATPDGDPEMDYLRRTYVHEFQKAFESALASLSIRERNILRYHFLAGRSIDEIGHLYNVHRATAARWIISARERLCKKTRDLLAERMSFSEAGFRRILSLIDSKISLRLSIAQDNGVQE